MMQRFMALPLALRVLVLIVALGALLTVIMGLPTLISSMSARFSGFVEGVAERQAERTLYTQEHTSQQQTDEYASRVKEINVGAVESFLKIDEKLRRFDSLTSDDVKDMKANREKVGDYLTQVENLEPPEEYKGQYALFRLAIADLDEAAGLAYSMAADPDSVTDSRLERYDFLIDRAHSWLQQSDEILERSSKTTSSQENK